MKAVNELVVVLPPGLPTLNAGAAAELLAILLEAHGSQSVHADAAHEERHGHHSFRLLRPGFHRGQPRPRVLPCLGKFHPLSCADRVTRGSGRGEFYHVDKSRSIPWQRRPQAARLLAEFRRPDRGFEAVVKGHWANEMPYLPTADSRRSTRSPTV